MIVSWQEGSSAGQTSSRSIASVLLRSVKGETSKACIDWQGAGASDSSPEYPRHTSHRWNLRSSWIQRPAVFPSARASCFYLSVLATLKRSTENGASTEPREARSACQGSAGESNPLRAIAGLLEQARELRRPADRRHISRGAAQTGSFHGQHLAAESRPPAGRISADAPSRLLKYLIRKSPVSGPEALSLQTHETPSDARP